MASQVLNHHKRLWLTAALALTTLWCGPLHAQGPTAFPQAKPLSLVVPYAPGGPTDAMARTLATAIRPVLGQTMVVENKAGAGANLGAEYVARAEADGYTLLFGTSAPLAINPYLYPRLNYDPARNFSPVIQIGYLPNVLVVHPSVPANNVRELIAYAKANKGRLSFASSGSGASSHLAGVMFNMQAGTDIQHIPYKGTGPALNDLLGGQVSMSFTDVLTALPHIQSGKLRVLGVTAIKRSRALPQVPTLDEQGLKDFDATVFFGIVVPSGTPQDVVTRLNAAFIQVVQQPEVKERLAKQGLEASPDYSPAQLAVYMRKEAAKWRDVIKASGATAD
jgi:tripartite-type tricarboxylate transporter receptor subunit TctC